MRTPSQSESKQKRTWTAPVVKTVDVQGSTVLLVCTGQFDCGRVGFPGCCSNNADECADSC